MMLDKCSSALLLAGRVLLSAMFIIFGFMKIGAFAGMVAYATVANIPFPEVAIVLAIIIELGAGLMLLFGYKTKLAAFAIALFLVPVTIYFHTNFADQVNLSMFWKNLAIMGGMLAFASSGAGKYSVDALLKPKR